MLLYLLQFYSNELIVLIFAHFDKVKTKINQEATKATLIVNKRILDKL